MYCRECYAKPQRAPVGRARYAPNATPPKRMLAMKRKGHFVYDAMRAFGDETEIDDEEQKRTFVEMVFARGSRQSTEDALDFIQEKQGEDTISSDEAQTLSRLVERYSMKR